jgi:hypothetical protein
MPAVLVVEFTGVFLSQNPRRGLENYGGAFPEEHTHQYRR